MRSMAPTPSSARSAWSFQATKPRSSRHLVRASRALVDPPQLGPPTDWLKSPAHTTGSLPPWSFSRSAFCSCTMRSNASAYDSPSRTSSGACEQIERQGSTVPCTISSRPAATTRSPEGPPRDADGRRRDSGGAGGPLPGGARVRATVVRATGAGDECRTAPAEGGVGSSEAVGTPVRPPVTASGVESRPPGRGRT